VKNCADDVRAVVTENRDVMQLSGMIPALNRGGLLVSHALEGFYRPLQPPDHPEKEAPQPRFTPCKSNTL
jgi:hypothetical protein